MTKLPRVDLCGVVQLDAATGKPVPGAMPARLDPRTGYLHVDGVLARSGVLTYSDGTRSWTEYRSADELKAWAPSFAVVPYTDGHPPALVDATSWAKVAKGVVVGPVTTHDGEDGLTYLHAPLMICDAERVAAVMRGEAVELSIGFLSQVVPHADGVAPDGTKCDASQLAGEGNHVAGVERGRAGPACRLMLDGAAVPTANPFPSLAHGHVPPMPQPSPKTDATEVTEVEIAAPDGSMISVPSWLAAELAELRAKVAAMPAPAVPDAAAMPAPQPPPMPMKPPEEETKDHAALLVRAGRLGLDAAEVLKLEPSKLREAVDAKSREVIAARAPGLVALAKTAKGDALAALVDASEIGTWGAPEPKPVKGAEKRTDSTDDEINARIAKALQIG